MLTVDWNLLNKESRETYKKQINTTTTKQWQKMRFNSICPILRLLIYLFGKFLQPHHYYLHPWWICRYSRIDKRSNQINGHFRGKGVASKLEIPEVALYKFSVAIANRCQNAKCECTFIRNNSSTHSPTQHTHTHTLHIDKIRSPTTNEHHLIRLPFRISYSPEYYSENIHRSIKFSTQPYHPTITWIDPTSVRNHLPLQQHK